MKPIGPLMHEHRLIERMLQVMKKQLGEATRNNSLDLQFIDTAVDFIRTYADRCHHGKEEDILFRELALKPLSQEHRRIMGELVAEHVYARSVVSRLVEARQQFVHGDMGAVQTAIRCLQELVEFYPVHIFKEDKHFFFPILDYLSPQEQSAMLQEFWEFDRKLIHEKYQSLVEQLESR